MASVKNGILISVIIPVFQSPQGLCDTVESAVAQNTSCDYEIVVVDNGSRDSTKQVGHKLADKYPDRVRILHEDSIQSSYAARNLGIRESRGKILCFIDADMTMPIDYISKIEKNFTDPELAYLGYRVEMICRRGTLMEAFCAANSFPMKYYFESGHFCGTGCLAVRREIFDCVGNFDHRLESGGDREFGERVYLAGLTQKFDNDIAVYHPAHYSYIGKIRKERRIARGVVKLSQLYPERYNHLLNSYFKLSKYIPLKRQEHCVAAARKSNRSGLGFLMLRLYYFPIRYFGLYECIKQIKYAKKAVRCTSKTCKAGV